MLKKMTTKSIVFLLALILVFCVLVGCENNVSTEVDNINDFSSQLGIGNNTIKLLADINAPEVELVSSNLSLLDLNGKTLTVKSFKINSNNEGLMTVSNGTIITKGGDLIFDTPNATLTLDKFVGMIDKGSKVRLNGSKNTINLSNGFKVAYSDGETAPLEIPGNTRVVVSENVTNGLILNVVGGDVIIENKSTATDNKIIIDETVSGSVEISNSGALKTVENKSENVNVKIANTDTATKPQTNGKVDVDGDNTVLFVTNGGSAVNNISVAKGQPINSSPLSERYGFEFKGWFKNAEMTDSVVFPFIPDGNISLFAKWEELPKYTVTFDLNGGNLDGANLTQTVYKGENVTDIGVPTKDNHIFKGWNPVLNLTNIQADAKYTAVWEELPKFTITFDLDGGTFANGESLTQVVYKGADGTAPSNPTKEGCTFDGWDPILKLDNIQANATYTAKWIDIPSYIITFDLDGGNFENGESLTQSIFKGENGTVPSDPKKANYIFKGWNPVLNLTNIQANATYTAVWEELPKFIITFDLDGGTFANGESLTQVVYNGANGVDPNNPTKTNYTFKGWNPVLNLTNIQANATYTAVWEELPKFTITFDLDGGTFANGESLTQVVYKGADGTAPSNPTKTNCIFKGWNPVLNLTNIQADATYTATWESVAPYVGKYFKLDEEYKYLAVEVFADGTAIFYDYPRIERGDIWERPYSELLVGYKFSYEKDGDYFQFLLEEVVNDTVGATTGIIGNTLSVQYKETDDILFVNYNSSFSGHYQKVTNEKEVNIHINDKLLSTIYFSDGITFSEEYIYNKVNVSPSEGYFVVSYDIDGKNLYNFDRINENKDLYIISNRDKTIDITQFYGEYVVKIPLNEIAGGALPEYDDSQTGFYLSISETITGLFLQNASYGYSEGNVEINGTVKSAIIISIYAVAYSMTKIYFCDDGNIYIENSDALPESLMSINKINNEDYCKVTITAFQESEQQKIIFANKKNNPLNEMVLMLIFDVYMSKIYCQDGTLYNNGNITSDLTLIVDVDEELDSTIPAEIKLLFGDQMYLYFKSEEFYLSLSRWSEDYRFELRAENFLNNNKDFYSNGIFTVAKDGNLNLKITLTAEGFEQVLIYNIENKQITTNLESTVIFYPALYDVYFRETQFLSVFNKNHDIRFNEYGFYYYVEENKGLEGDGISHREMGRYSLAKKQGTDFYDITLQKFNETGYEDSTLKIAYNWFGGYIIIDGKGEFYSDSSNVTHPAVGKYYFTDVLYSPFVIDSYGFVYDTVSEERYLGRLITVYNEDYTIKGFNVNGEFISFDNFKKEGVYKGRTFKKSPFDKISDILGMDFYSQDDSAINLKLYPFGKVKMNDKVGQFTITLGGNNVISYIITLDMGIDGKFTIDYHGNKDFYLESKGEQIYFNTDKPEEKIRGVDYIYGEYSNIIDNTEVYLFLEFDKFYLKITDLNTQQTIVEIYGYSYIADTQWLHLVGINNELMITANYKISSNGQAELDFSYNEVKYTILKELIPSEQYQYLFSELANHLRQNEWHNQENYDNYLRIDGNESSLSFELTLVGFENEIYKGNVRILGANYKYIYLELSSIEGAKLYVNLDILNNQVMVIHLVGAAEKIYYFSNGQKEVPTDIRGRYTTESGELNIDNEARFNFAINGENPTFYDGKIQYWFIGDSYIFKMYYNIDGKDKTFIGRFDINAQVLTFTFEGVEYTLSKEYVAPSNEFDGYYNNEKGDFITIERASFAGTLSGIAYNGTVESIIYENDYIRFNLIQDTTILECVFNKITRDLSISLDNVVIAEFINYPFMNYYQDNNGNNINLQNYNFNALLNNQNYEGMIIDIVKTEIGYNFKLNDVQSTAELVCNYSNEGILTIVNENLGINLTLSNQSQGQNQPFVGSYYDENKNMLNLNNDSFDCVINGANYYGQLTIVEEVEKEYIMLSLIDQEQKLEFSCRYTYDGNLVVENKDLGINLSFIIM